MEEIMLNHMDYWVCFGYEKKNVIGLHLSQILSYIHPGCKER